MYEILKVIHAGGRIYIDIFDAKMNKKLLYEITEVKKIKNKQLRLFLYSQIYWIKQGEYKRVFIN